MFGKIVYTLPKGSAAENSPGNKQLLVKINFSYHEVAVANSKDILIQWKQLHIFAAEGFTEIVTVILDADVSFAVHLTQCPANIILRLFQHIRHLTRAFLIVLGGNVQVERTVRSFRVELQTIAVKQLLGVSQIVSECGANVVSVHHERSDVNMAVTSCFLKVDMETRDFEQIAQIRQRLTEAGFKIVN